MVAAMTSLCATRAADSNADWKKIPLIDNGKVASDWVHIGYGSMQVEGDALLFVIGQPFPLVRDQYPWPFINDRIVINQDAFQRCITLFVFDRFSFDRCKTRMHRHAYTDEFQKCLHSSLSKE